MISGIIGALLPVILKIIEGFLDKNKAKRETIKAFYDFIEKLDKDSLVSVKLKHSYADQLKRLKEKAEKESNVRLDG